MLHLLRDCPTVRSIWSSVGVPNNHTSFFTDDLSTWIACNIDPKQPTYHEKLSLYFATTLWWSWKWRNYFVFGRRKDIPINTGAFLLGRVKETWLAAQEKTDCNTLKSKTKIEVFVRWISPPPDWVCLNTYGASKGAPRLASGGGVLRDSRGMFIHGFSTNFGICSTDRAELAAMEIGLKLAQSLGIRKLLIQMDNKACIEVLNNLTYQGGECYYILNNCRRIIGSREWETRFNHCYPEGNKVADKLANLGVVQGERVVYFDVPPHEVIRLPQEDIWRK